MKYINFNKQRECSLILDNVFKIERYMIIISLVPNEKEKYQHDPFNLKWKLFCLNTPNSSYTRI